MRERIPVDSSMLKSLEYDHETRSLYASFKTGKYRYDSVPHDTFVMLADAANNGESVGKLFHATILKAGYAFEKL